MYNYDLSVVIPCLNEEETIEVCIKKCLQTFERLNINGEIIISDNQSTDNSVKIATKLGAKTCTCSKKGYGITLRTGIEQAQGKYILIGDGDDSYDFNQIDNYYNKIRDGSDMVIGTRLRGKIHKGAMPFLHRYLGTPVLTALVNIFWGLKLSDSQCGMRMFKKESLDKLNLECDGMEFASELLIKAAINKWQISEIPLEFFKDGRNRKPHLNPWKDGLRHLKLIFRSKFLETLS